MSFWKSLFGLDDSAEKKNKLLFQSQTAWAKFNREQDTYRGQFDARTAGELAIQLRDRAVLQGLRGAEAIRLGRTGYQLKQMEAGLLKQATKEALTKQVNKLETANQEYDRQRGIVVASLGGGGVGGNLGGDLIRGINTAFGRVKEDYKATTQTILQKSTLGAIALRADATQILNAASLQSMASDLQQAAQNLEADRQDEKAAFIINGLNSRPSELDYAAIGRYNNSIMSAQRWGNMISSTAGLLSLANSAADLFKRWKF